MTKTPQRRAAVRLLIAIPLCGMLVATSLAAAWLAIGRPTVASGAVWFQLTKVGDTEFSGVPDAPFFFLALGNDGRTDADKGLGDAIHVIGVNPAARQATIINVPRDTQAPSGDKINAYHALQGLQGTVDQLDRMMGISIQYAMTVNFPRFVNLVNEVGGVDFNVPIAMNDKDSGAIFSPGPQRLSGESLLAIARNRKDYPIEGDVKRSENQGLIILATLATLRAQNPGDAGALRLASILARHVVTENVSLVDMFRLGRLGLSIDPAAIRNVTIPVGGGAGSNLAVGPGAAELFRDFADDGILQSH
ncbi:MAG TPA: LCP family protein [Acidimicrobiia bacterium]|nr:LCP family protein [Acidimicrobiia bacterium]